MLTALQLPVFDQTLSEVSAIERAAEFLGRLGGGADRVLKLGQLVSNGASFVGHLALVDPFAWTRTEDVWASAESLERPFFGIYVAAHTISFAPIVGGRSSTQQARERLASVLGPDLATRLEYAQALMNQGSHRGKSGPTEARQREKAFLDNDDVPPEIRLVIQEARCLPVLLVYAFIMDAPTFEGDRPQELVKETIRECLDHMISFMLGTYEWRGLRPVAAPDGLELPDPIEAAKIDEQWKHVQATWNSC